MENINIPLISPLSRKYYQYANDDSEKIHHRAEDVRICLEKICDSIVFQLVSTKTKQKWKKNKLHDKLNACKEFMNSQTVDDALNVKNIGNDGVHNGEEGGYSQQNIRESLETIKRFSLEIILSYFEIYGFGGNQHRSWVPTVFSVLPPVYRVQILKKYYVKNPSLLVIDKLAKALLKNDMKKEAFSFLAECYTKGQISQYEFERLEESLKILESHLDKFSIAHNLDEAKSNFLRLLPSIAEDERDSFVILVSMILTGELPDKNCQDN